MLTLAIVWALFVPVADWLAHHDVGTATELLHETALDNARGRLLTLGAGLLAAGALLFTARNFTLSREGQVTDRYTKTIEQLGSDKLDVRIGGIYALERIARDSARDHPTVMEVLTAFIREHSHEQLPAPQSRSQSTPPTTRPDVQAAVTVVGRRDEKLDIRRADLSGADLRGANLSGAFLGGFTLMTRSDVTLATRSAVAPPRLRDDGRRFRSGFRGFIRARRRFTFYTFGADLSRADLSSADLRYADLNGADLTSANLSDGNLSRADLSRAHLNGADLTRADLGGANLSSADLSGAHLDGARIDGARLAWALLTGADLTGADLTGADLTDANLTGANLSSADLSGADLTAASWPGDTPVPEGWVLGVNSGRLYPADNASGPREAK